MRKKARQNLAPVVVARELGISLRQLHVVFEGAELSFSRTLSTMRIEEAKRLLLAFPALPVTQIAYGCGFDSLATFYRVFASTYGMTPGETRIRSRTDRRYRLERPARPFRAVDFAGFLRGICPHAGTQASYSR